MTKDLTTGNPMPLILKFMLPLFGGNVFQQLYNLVDTVIVGQYLGINALASVGACSAIMFLVIGFCGGICAGFSIPVAQRFGAKDETALRKFTANGWYLGILFAAVLTLLTVLFCRPILIAMKTPPELLDDSFHYLVIIFWGIPFTILYNYTAGIIRAIGDSKTPFLFLVLSTVLNIFLDLFCILRLNMGVSGAALATIISQAVSGLLCYLYMTHSFPILKYRKGETAPDAACLHTLLIMGVPMGLQYSITAIGSIMLQSAVNLLGTVYVASYDTALKIKSLCVGTCDALGNTMAVYCGQNLGAGKKDRIHAGIRDAMRIGAVGSVFFIFFLWNFTDQISLLFMDASNTEVIANIRLFMRITSCFYPLLYLLNIFRFSVQGMGESRIAMFAGVIEMVARTVSGLFLIPAAGYIMVCYTDQLAWLWATLFLVVVYRSILKKAL
jgi:putative MATE family efflux protein